MLDKNAATNSDVKAAQKMLVKTLLRMNAKVKIATIPQIADVNGPDDLVQRRGDQAVLDIIAAATDYAPDSEDKAQAKKLVNLGLANELFHTADSTPYAVLNLNGHREIWPTHSKAFRDHLSFKFFEDTGAAPSAQAVRDALATLDGIARFKGGEYEVHVRVAAEGDDTIWLDLADANWRAVKITPSGWRVVDEPTVRFRRSSGSVPLPQPERGGSIDELRRFVNVTDPDDWTLLISWVVAAMRPRGPYAILYLLGEQGSAKSTVARVFRDLIDPYKAPLRTIPRDERDLYVCANASWVIGFDNVSAISPMLSDALCRLATGGGFSTRTLYTDMDETLFDAMRPMVMNGISEGASRGDFLERAVMVNLPVISEDKRRDENVFWSEFREAQPRILGAVLDGVSAALRNYKDVVMPAKPRMADFAIWATAAESGLGFKPGAFMAAYRVNRSATNEIPLEASPIAQHLQALASDGWKGKTKELLAELTHLESSDKRMPKGWPESPRKLASDLKRLAPNLRAVGVDVQISSTRLHGYKTITLSKQKGDTTPPTSPMSPNREESTSSLGDVSSDVSNVNRDISPYTSTSQVEENNDTSDVGDVGDVFPLSANKDEGIDDIDRFSGVIE